jgi:serine/threonine protein kinase
MKRITNPDEKYYMREVEAMATIDHPAVLSLIGWRYPDAQDPPIVVTEYCPNGTLLQAMQSSWRGKPIEGWTPTKQSIAVIGIACGMNAIHAQNIMHRDLKPANVFLDTNFHPRIADFGRARLDDDIQRTRLQSATYAVAPETYDENGHYTTKVDVYSYGVMLYMLFREANTLDDRPTEVVKSDVQLMNRLLRGARFVRDPKIPDFYWDLIVSCWAGDPSVRPAFEQIVDMLKRNRDGYAFPGTNMAELQEYETRVLPAAEVEVQFDPADRGTALPGQEVERPIEPISWWRRICTVF